MHEQLARATAARARVTGAACDVELARAYAVRARIAAVLFA